MKETIIPQKIHFCWFGNGDIDEKSRMCIKSWQKKLPEFEIKVWNEKNFDIDSCKYTKEAYKAKKWAFVSDYVRMWALYNEGGIYLDSDVEVIKSLDTFLGHKAFFGFENKYTISTAVIGCERNSIYIKKILDFYNNKSFYKSKGKEVLTPNTKIVTDILVGIGLKKNGENQIVNSDIAIYRQEFFSPKSYLTGKVNITNNTYLIHHFTGSWIKKSSTSELKKLVFNIIGEDLYLLLANEKNKIVDKLKIK